MLDAVKIEEGCIIGTLDIIGMFPNVQVQKTLEVVKGKAGNGSFFEVENKMGRKKML